MKRKASTAVLLLVVLAGTPANAQRATEAAINTAEDAFGISVGNETVGLYNPNSARGFNPTQAGNIRIEGLYFDQQVVTQGRIYADTTMRVGLSAQSYPFVAPTGVADIRLRLPGREQAGTVSFTFGPYNTVQAEVEASTPVIQDKLGVLVTMTGTKSKFDTRGELNNAIYGGVLNWKPTDRVDVLAFVQGHAFSGEPQPFIFTATGEPPPEYDRSVDFGQPWAIRYRNSHHVGAIVSASLPDDWRLRVGLFRSHHTLPGEEIVIFRNVQADGVGTLDILRTAPNGDLSYSGEARLTRVFAEGPRRHAIHFSARGRDLNRKFGGGGANSLGPARIGVFEPKPEPPYVLSPAARDRINQVTPGLAYVGRWADVGELGAGVQKTFYRRTVTLPGFASARTKAEPWLYNGTVAVYLSDAAALYGSYTRGFEESGIAPENASNRAEALPASMTEQVDAGIRYKPTPAMTMIAGLFEVRKPYFDRNAANLFTQVGNLTHRGVELSVSGQLAPGLTVVAGAMFLRARIVADAAVASFIGPVPIGRPSRNLRLSAQYGPPSWRGFAIDGQISQDGPAFANRINTVKLEANTTLDLGARYTFKAFGTTASIRARAFNVTNTYGWTVSPSGSYAASGARRYSVQVIADF